MTQRTWGKRFDWVEGNRRTLELEEFGEEEEKSRKGKDDWRGTGVGGESWRQRRVDLRVKERRMQGLGEKEIWRLKGGKDGSRGEGRGGVRPG
jgi:hypothetical protein